MYHIYDRINFFVGLINQNLNPSNYILVYAYHWLTDNRSSNTVHQINDEAFIGFKFNHIHMKVCTVYSQVYLSQNLFLWNPQEILKHLFLFYSYLYIYMCMCVCVCVCVCVYVYVCVYMCVYTVYVYIYIYIYIYVCMYIYILYIYIYILGVARYMKNTRTVRFACLGSVRVCVARFDACAM